jgi:hypothetical protein
MSKKETEQAVNEAFSQWHSAIDTMIEQAEAGFMPLLKHSFLLCKEILTMYEKAFKSGLKKEKK